jgi:4-amino-4-deoxy-L-arabinose transferase
VKNEFGRNPQWYKPFVIYLPVLLGGQGAWLAFGARIPRAEGLASPRRLLARLRRGDAASFLLLWLLLPLALFFLSTSRLPLYVLPLFAPIALAVARTLARDRAAAAPRRALTIAIPSALVLVALKAGRLRPAAVRQEHGAAAGSRPP